MAVVANYFGEMVCEHFRIPSIAGSKTTFTIPLNKTGGRRNISLCSKLMNKAMKLAMIFDTREELVLLATTVVERLQLESRNLISFCRERLLTCLMCKSS